MTPKELEGAILTALVKYTVWLAVVAGLGLLLAKVLP